MDTAFPWDWGWSVFLFLGYSSTPQRRCRRRGRGSGCVYDFKGFWHSSLLNECLWNYFFSVSVPWACPLVWKGLATLSSFFMQQLSLAMKVNLPTYEIFINIYIQASAVEFFSLSCFKRVEIQVRVKFSIFWHTWPSPAYWSEHCIQVLSVKKYNKNVLCVCSGHIRDFFFFHFIFA